MAVTARGPTADEVVSATVRAFDRLAPRYDALCAGELFRAMRARVHGAIDRALPPGARVLEIGCGSGLDTAWLAARGSRVIAADPSAVMLERARARVADDRTGRAVRFVCCGLDALDRHLGPSCRFEAIVSNFGALNCVPRLDALGHLAASRLEPGGRAFVCLMSRICLWEIGWFLLKGRPDGAFRRLRPPPVLVGVEGIPVPTWYHRVGDVARAVAPSLAVRAVSGCGVLVPPPYLEDRWRAVPAPVRRVAAAADAALARVAPFNRLGDHVLVELGAP